MPIEMTAQLGALLEPLHLPAAARWMRGASIHVTLVFIGPTRPDAAPGIAATMAEVAARHEPIELRLGRAGSFGGGGRPRVAWIGIAEGVDALRRLAEELAPLVLPRAPAPPRSLTPHITVARRATDDLVPRLDEVLAAAPTVNWTADRMVHYRSHLGIGPPVHEALFEVPLGGRPGP